MKGVPLVHLVAQDLTTKAMRDLKKDHLSGGGMPVVQRGSSQWHDRPSLATWLRLWQRVWDVDVRKIDWRVWDVYGAWAILEVALVIFREVAASYTDRPHVYTDSSSAQEEVGYGVCGEALRRRMCL